MGGARRFRRQCWAGPFPHRPPNQERHMRTPNRRIVGSAVLVAAGLVVTLTSSASAGAQAQRAATAPAPASDPGLARLEAEMTRLATIAGGKVGVAAKHLES